MSFFSFQDIIACTTGIMVLLTLMLTMELLTRTLNAPEAPPTRALDDALAEALAARDALRDRAETLQAVLAQTAGGAVATQTRLNELRKTLAAQRELKTATTGRLAQVRRELTTVTDTLTTRQQDAATAAQARKQVEQTVAVLSRQTPVTVLDRSGDDAVPFWVECSQGRYLVCRIEKTGSQAGVAQEVTRFEGDEAMVRFMAWAAGRDRAGEKFVLLIRPDAVAQWQEVAARLGGMGFLVGWDAWPVGRNLTGEEQ